MCCPVTVLVRTQKLKDLVDIDIVSVVILVGHISNGNVIVATFILISPSSSLHRLFALETLSSMTADVPSLRDKSARAFSV